MSQTTPSNAPGLEFFLEIIFHLEGERMEAESALFAALKNADTHGYDTNIILKVVRTILCRNNAEPRLEGDALTSTMSAMAMEHQYLNEPNAPF